ncbi:MAG: hypothetical protein JO162_10605 [Alphaproteobacteria bacterium]|nr:hypothetical protein [Alphaproteobacteria bacterium]
MLVEKQPTGTGMVGIMVREFYRSARGPSPTDEDTWRLAFDPESGSLMVRHEWQSERHAGADEFGIAEFLAEQGGAQKALLALFFGEAMADA